MPQWSILAGAILLAAADAPGQTFDVATIRPNVAKGVANLAVTPGMLTIRNLPLLAIIEGAYGVAEYQVSGPAWLAQERFDIVAKTDVSVTDKDEMLRLLRPLLTERFHLATHRQTRLLPAYLLLVESGGPKLEAAEGGAADLPFKKANKSTGARIHSAHLTMPQFADMLARHLARPVLDRTELSGTYRVTLEWTPENKSTNAGKPEKVKPDTDRPSIFTALHEQLGLRLQAHKAPVETIVIDHIDKTPTAN